MEEAASDLSLEVGRWTGLARVRSRRQVAEGLLAAAEATAGATPSSREAVTAVAVPAIVWS